MNRNKSDPGLSYFVSKTDVEETHHNKTVASILLVLKEKYDLSERKKYEQLLNMMSTFKPGKNNTEESVFSKIEQIETEFKNLKLGENIQYFLVTFVMKEILANDVINESEKKSIQGKV